MKLALLNSQLAAYRGKHKLSLQKMADLLKVTSGSTINNWEHGDPIPGPPSILLDWLINGKVPFQELTVPPSVRDEMWKVTMNLEAFERMDALRLAGGYATVTDFIAGLIQEELAQSATVTRTSDHGAVDEMALVSEGGDAVGGHLDAAASAFAKENPLPAAGESGGTAGTTGSRKDVRYTRPPGLRGTGAGKRK